MISSPTILEKAVKYISIIDNHVKDCEHCRALLKAAHDENNTVSGYQPANPDQLTISAGQNQNGSKTIPRS